MTKTKLEELQEKQLEIQDEIEKLTGKAKNINSDLKDKDEIIDDDDIVVFTTKSREELSRLGAEITRLNKALDDNNKVIAELKNNQPVKGKSVFQKINERYSLYDKTKT